MAKTPTTKAKMPKTKKESPYPDPSARSFFEVGDEFFRDAQALISLARGVVTNPAYFLIGFALELVLKSYIVHVGIKQVKDEDLRIHNLCKLWKWAAKGSDSPFTVPAPGWLEPVNEFHAEFRGRYRGAGIQSFSIPGPAQREEIAALIEQVRRVVAQ